MGKPTDGPWEQHGTLIFKNGPEGGTICSMGVLRGSNYVEYHPMSLSDPDWDEQMANARLIAAAPRMFAHLVAIRDSIRMTRLDNPARELLRLVDDALEGLE